MKTKVLHLVWTGENRGFRKRLRQLREKKTINIAGYLAFGGLVWTGRKRCKKACVDEKHL